MRPRLHPSPPLNDPTVRSMVWMVEGRFSRLVTRSLWQSVSFDVADRRRTRLASRRIASTVNSRGRICNNGAENFLMNSMCNSMSNTVRDHVFSSRSRKAWVSWGNLGVADRSLLSFGSFMKFLLGRTHTSAQIFESLKHSWHSVLSC